MEISITAKQLKPDDLIETLENTPEWQSEDVQLILRKKTQPFRSLDPTIVVAIISATSMGLGALITGILNAIKATKSQRIIIQDKDGRRLEIPAEYPKEKIQELAKVIAQMEAVKIEIL